ncbi:MAG: copper chaperone PCu(A)C, partial [Quisquiliibacterium sp.]
MIFPILRALMVGASIGLLVYATPAWAQTSVKVKFPWVRATVPAQQTTGAFMTLIARQDSRLVAVDSPIAGLIEIHQMRVEGDVMRMRRIDAIDLPAGQE